MSNSRPTQCLLHRRVGSSTTPVSSVGSIMASPVVLTATAGFDPDDGTFTTAMLVALLPMLAQSTTFAGAACLLPTRDLICDYLSCGLGYFFVITGALPAYLIVRVFAGTAETMLSGAVALANFELLNTLTKPGGGVWLAGVGMVLYFDLLNALGITVFGRTEVILTFDMQSTLMISVVAGLLRLPTTGLQGWFGASMVGGSLSTLLSLVGMTMFMFVGCEFITPLAPKVRHASWTPPRAMALGLVGMACCIFLYDTAMCRQVEDLDLGGGLHPLETSMAIPRFAEQVMGLFGYIWPGVDLLFAGVATINTLMAGLSRILYGMALDDVLSEVFTYLHPHFKTPLLCIVVAMAAPCLHAWWLGGDSEGAIYLALAAVCAWGIVYLLMILFVALLRIRRLGLPRAYRPPLFPLPQLFSSAGVLLGMFHITSPGMNPVDIYLSSALIPGLAATYALFWTLCIQRVDPFRPLTVEEVLRRELAREDQQQREKAHVRLDALV